ncbi:MAG: hypothetical protein ACR2HN_01615 [Tepidiformaceae bacterium]
MPWFWPEQPAMNAFDPNAQRAQATLPLALRMVVRFDPATVDASPGRRLRAFATLVCRGEAGIVLTSLARGEQLLVSPVRETTYGELLARVEREAEMSPVRDTLTKLPLRIGDYGPLIRELPSTPVRTPRDPDLHPALQDLGDEINEDIREALESLDNPNLYFPGIDEGIEPVTDEHVKLVTWALQRELDRELRTGSGSLSSLAPLPAAPLADLPWDIQRALAERRRWRYRQWGLGKEQWESGDWNLWEIPRDDDYVPRRSARLMPVV